MLTLDSEDSDDSVDDDDETDTNAMKMAKIMEKFNQAKSIPMGTTSAHFNPQQQPQTQTENGFGFGQDGFVEVAQKHLSSTTTTQTPISLTQPLPLYQVEYENLEDDYSRQKNQYLPSTFKIYENQDTQVNFPHSNFDYSQRLIEFIRNPQETVIKRRHQTHGTQTRKPSHSSALNQQHQQQQYRPISSDKLNPSLKNGTRAKTATSPSQSPRARNIKSSRISHPSNLVTVKVKGLDDSYQCFKNADGNSGTIICTKKPTTSVSGQPTSTMPMPITTTPAAPSSQPTGRKISLSAISRQKLGLIRPYSIKISPDVPPGVSASKCPLNLNADASTNDGQATTILVMNKHTNNNNNSSRREDVPELPEWLRKSPNREKRQTGSEVAEEDKEKPVKTYLSRSQSRSRTRSRSPIKSLHYQSSTTATASKTKARTKSNSSPAHSPLRKPSILYSSPSSSMKQKVNLKSMEVQTIIHLSTSTQNAGAVAVAPTADAFTNSEKIEELKSVSTQISLNLNRPVTQPTSNKTPQKKQSQIRNQPTIKKSTINNNNNNNRIQSKTSNAKSSASVNNKTGEGFKNQNQNTNPINNNNNQGQNQKTAKSPILAPTQSNNKIPPNPQNSENQKRPKSGTSTPKQTKNLNSPASTHSPDPNKGIILNPPSSFSSESKVTIESEFKKLLEQKPPILWIFGYTQVNTAGKVGQIIEALKTKLNFHVVHLDSIISIWRKNDLFKNTLENSKEPRNLDLEDSICFHAKKTLLKIKPMANSMTLGTQEILKLLKLAIVSAQAREHPNGFIIYNFPVNSDEGEKFQKFFYPFSAGLYFLDSAWSRSRQTPPKIIPPSFFQRNPPYSEFSVEKAADFHFGAKTMKILNTEELDDQKMDDIVFIVTEHLRGFGQELRTKKKNHDFQKHKIENEQLKSSAVKTAGGGNDQRRSIVQNFR